MGRGVRDERRGCDVRTRVAGDPITSACGASGAPSGRAPAEGAAALVWATPSAELNSSYEMRPSSLASKSFMNVATSNAGGSPPYTCKCT